MQNGKKISKKGFLVTPIGLVETDVLFYWSRNIPKMKLSEQLIHHALKYDRLALFVRDDVLYIWNISRSESFYSTKTFSTTEWIQNREKN